MTDHDASSNVGPVEIATLVMLGDDDKPAKRPEISDPSAPLPPRSLSEHVSHREALTAVLVSAAIVLIALWIVGALG